MGNYVLDGLMAVNGLNNALNTTITAITGMTEELNKIATFNNDRATACAKEGAAVMMADANDGDKNNQVSVDQQIYSAYNQAFQNVQTLYNGLIQTDGTNSQNQGQNQQMWTQFAQDLMQMVSSITSLLGSGKL